MPYKDKSDRSFKKDYKAQKARGKEEHERRMDRQRARRAMDKAGVDRDGKVIDHIQPLSKGGSNKKSNLRLVSRKSNASYPRNSDHTPKTTRKKK